MRAVVPNLLLAGVALALLEVVWVLVRARALFLSLGERTLFALASCTGLASCVLAIGAWLWFSGQSGRAPKLARLAWSLTCGVLAARLLWSVSEGRRVRDLAGRPYVVVALALVLGASAWCLPILVRYGRRARWSLPALAMLLALALLCADALILPRGYPGFHLGLACLAVVLASLAGLIAPPLLMASDPRRGWLACALVLLAAPLLLARLATHPTAGFAVRETAPWSAKLTQLFTSRRAPRSVASAPLPSVDAQLAQRQQGVDLRDRDVLLITVDALRADLLRAYGGSGKTPELDKLASQSAVFLRAYTPAPHTSYALASLLTGKFVKPLVELGGKLGDPPTLPDRLRRYGYRTAAFYPPAIFFVDGASFEPLQKRGFGFEYRKEMFASAPERVEQLSAYLREADSKKPLFAWVHLFEPHEPYDPPAGVAHDGSERGRYEAEVAVCDRAIAQLVANFRSARPNATVIITADHGEEFGDHGGSFHGTTLYDEQVRIPLLWSSPGVVAPQQISAPVELTDLGTTILSTAAILRDAHMRGDELGALLAGHTDGAPAFAFASIDARQMVSDGRHKLICSAADEPCALFDLERDRSEVQNLAGEQPAEVARLRQQLELFLGSIARTEAVTVSAGVRMPEVLARAKLAGTAHVDEVLPLLADAQSAVRLEAARVLGELGMASAGAALDRVRLFDDDPAVRSEAAIAQLRLGEAGPLLEVLALLHESDPGQLARTRRAAIALAGQQREEAIEVLAALSRDEGATESDRLRAVRALGTVGSALGVPPLVHALSFVRLREAVAQALAQLGGPVALQALREQLQSERYPPARAAEISALALLHDSSVEAELRHFLGMESSLPLGVRALAQLGGLTPSDRRGALLSDPRVRLGSWLCERPDAGTPELGCAPGPDATLALPRRGPALHGPVRVTVWFQAAEQGSVLRVDGQRFALQSREDQLSFVRTAAPERLSFAGEGQLLVAGVVVAPAVAEIPPPAPEPWVSDAGVSANEPAR